MEERYRLTECRKQFNAWADTLGFEGNEKEVAWFGWRAAWNLKKDEPTRESYNEK